MKESRQLVVAEKTPQTMRHDSTITITVPTVLDHEVIAIDL
jgi:hypothetical protein